MTLTLSLLLGLAAFFVTAVARAVVPATWLLHKPLSCDLCMSWWTSVIVVGLANVLTLLPANETALVFLASGGSALLLTKTLGRLTD